MGNTMQLKIGDVKRAFDAEAGKLHNGELSRYLPGFTALEVVHESTRNFSEEWDVFYIATRIRDGKTYGYAFRDSYDRQQGVFYEASTEPNKVLIFHEMTKKVYTSVYYEKV